MKLKCHVNDKVWRFNSRQISVRAKLEHRFLISFMTVCSFERCFTLFLSFGVSAQLKAPPITKFQFENPIKASFKS